MRYIRNPRFFILFMILGFWVLFFSIWDVVFGEGWSVFILASYALLIGASLVIIILKSKGWFFRETSVEKFEKTLEGRLYHFKCPICDGIFAIKKSKRNNKIPIKMTCPDCGEMAVIPSFPKQIEKEIPEKKSVNVNCKCDNCGEDLTIWAEGSELYPFLQVYNCPYCGEKESMNCS